MHRGGFTARYSLCGEGPGRDRLHPSGQSRRPLDARHFCTRSRCRSITLRQPSGSLSLKNHLGLRDYLRAHPEVALQYGDLKETLARQFPEDIDRYSVGKTDFILGILQEIGFTDEELAEIRNINRMENPARPVTS